MEISLDEIFIATLLVPVVFLVGFILFVFIMAGPKYYKLIKDGGNVEVLYTPKNTSYIHQHIIPQPSQFVPIKMNSCYFIGIVQPDQENNRRFTIAVVEEKEDQKYVIRQELKHFNGTYSTAKEVAELYAQNYSLTTRRLF